MSGVEGKERQKGQDKTVDSGVQPVRPEDVVDEKIKQIPDEVIESFNELISQGIRGGYVRFLQKDVVKLMEKRGLDIDEAFEKGWLDVEGLYEEAGWDVEYDKPGFNETYDESFSFTSKKKK